MTLARDTGHVNVDAMEEQITERQLVQWAQFYKQDPQARRADMRSAVVAHTVYQMLRGKHAPQRTVESFSVVDHGRKDRIAALKAMIRRSGRRVDDGAQ